MRDVFVVILWILALVAIFVLLTGGTVDASGNPTGGGGGAASTIIQAIGANIAKVTRQLRGINQT